ncbi:beta-1,3-galactosyltransferase 5-like [Sycon ciliatum]|uniref:beta-1,3-galactosyltransferase 5-like n=1 Tax=Sycon ciliatum TaxID=27933 RepID=UPI0020A87C57|eukprot:scpid83015/ scgid12277/ Beta-1,3-galactosyltransferase 2; UDP-Gal:betaGlcNAc beta 1,3-galactosyltransferase-II
MQRGISRPIAFFLGGLMALLMNRLTYPETQPAMQHQQFVTSEHLMENAEPFRKKPAEVAKEPDQKNAPAGGGEGIVVTDTYVRPKLEWVDANHAMPSQKEVTSTCQTRLLVLIMSDARQQWKRDAQRESWAVDVARYATLGVNKADFKYVFILGRLFDQIPDKVVQEAHKARDIIVSDINDYDIDGATNKSVWALRWALQHCTFTHVLKTMDHAFVNVPLIISQWLPRMEAGSYFAGHRLTDVVVNRDPNLNWYISEEDYPKSKYPTYPQQDYVLSRDVADDLVKVMNRTFTRIYYDDVAVAHALATGKPKLSLQHEPNVIHLCTPAVSRPYVVLKVLEAADMKKYGADMFSKQIICHLSRK